MLKLFRRIWSYLTALGNRKFEESADPKVQLEQAITDAREQHERLKEQAANVIANQKQTEMRLSRTLEELEEVNGKAQQALRLAAEAEQAGDASRAAEYNAAAESFANRLIGIEQEADDLKELVMHSSQAADEAKEAVRRNGADLQRKLSERQKLLSQMDQAKMSEQLNAAMGALNERVGGDSPSFKEIEEKIEARYAKAKGVAELQSDSHEGRMRDVEHSLADTRARSRLDEMRADMGLAPGAASAGEVESGPDVSEEAEETP